jgi:TonB-linked SusC/RagA family outer membrane protein
MRKVTLLLLGLTALFATALAQRTITGKVTDDKGSPLANVSVLVKGSTIGTTAKLDGSYTITVPANATTLVFSAIGMLEKEVAIGTLTVINTSLIFVDQAIGEVVVTGYAAKRRTEFTGSATKVSAKQIEQVPLASFEQMLQGQAPGVYIASGSGQPGSTARVNIRGVGSFGNSNPLYILDGIPIEDGVFRTLNPNDFESIDILKDAAGTGLYGSRGANGVVVITTKKGKTGKARISYRGQAGIAQAPSSLNLTMMNTTQRLQYEEMVGQAGLLSTTAASGYPGWDYSAKNPRYLTFTQAQKDLNAHLLDSIGQINTDWISLFTRDGKFLEQEVNASGGANGMTYYTSLSYYKQEGVLERSDLQRYTYRGNIDFKSDRLTVGIRTSAGFSQLNGIESEAGVALANPIAAAYLELPYKSLYKNGIIDTNAAAIGANAYERVYNTTALTNQFKGNLSLTLQLDIWGGIAIKSVNGVDWRNNNSSRFINPTSYAGNKVAIGQSGSYNEGNAENLQLITTTGLIFNNTYAGKHRINASAMIEAIRNRSRSNGFTGYGLNPRLPNTPAAITVTPTLLPALSGGRTYNGLFSYFASADYTYNRKYTVSAVIRNDAPSQLPEANRNNWFWTAGASWSVSSEEFMSKQKIFQDVRLRASWGEVANINGLGSDFGYISTYGSTSTVYGGAIIPTSPGNEDYQLESQVQKNVGLEFAMLNRRIRVTADLYEKESKDLFLNQEISRTTGFTQLRINAGAMKNTGFEFDVKGDAVKNRDLVVTVGVNGAFLRNRITSLGQIKEIAAGTGISRVGLPFGTHYIVGYLGVDPQTGQPVYEDINGNPTSVYSTANYRATYGTYLPKFTGGASLDVMWKGFNLTALFHTAQGVKRFNNESFFYETTNANLAYNKRIELLQSWQKPGDITNFQRIASTRQFSSKDIRDASFIRFRNLNVGYTFTPKTEKYVRSVRLWGQAQNLYTWTKWTGFDPEESNNIATYEFPNPKTFTIGLDVNF